MRRNRVEIIRKKKSGLPKYIRLLREIRKSSFLKTNGLDWIEDDNEFSIKEARRDESWDFP